MNLTKSSTSTYSEYEGCYDKYGRRENVGTQTWVRDKEQKYHGPFLRDCLHGEGVYEWKEGRKRTVYEGNFYSNFKEGYALVSLPNGSCFEGLFYRNRAFGPGVMTYSNGRQDAGFWLGEKLIRLSRTVDFIVPRLAPSSLAKIKLLQFRRLIPIYEEEFYTNHADESSRLFSNFIHEPRSLFFNRVFFEKAYFVGPRDSLKLFPADSQELHDTPSFKSDAEANEQAEESPGPDHCVCHDEEFVMNYRENSRRSGFEEWDGEIEIGLLGYYSKYGTLHGTMRSFPRLNGRMNSERNLLCPPNTDKRSSGCLTHLMSWNRSELFTEMLKQIFRFRSFEEQLTFRIARLMSGARTKFRRTGYKEKECIDFLKMCSLGPVFIVKELLSSSDISEDLMDARGNNSLMFAVAADQHEIIDILLDHGVDINSFNDEGLTPLNFCLLRRLAQANEILNWEAAFLPPNPKFQLGEGIKLEDWRARESIESLDRIFGEGRSIDESIIAIKADLEAIREERERQLTEEQAVDVAGETEPVTDIGSVTLLEFTPETGKGCKREELESEKTGQDMKTPDIITNIVPKSIRREEFVNSIAAPSKSDRYFFDLSPSALPSEDKTKEKKDGKAKVGQIPVIVVAEEKSNYGAVQRIEAIDKTIELLLTRGASPNMSDVPKPSLHLAIYTKNTDMVKRLLECKASPDFRCVQNEGFLTPLHLIALSKPTPELTDFCQILLNYGADPDLETTPDFNPNGDLEILLDVEHGRTPIQLLCLRPDLCYADPERYLTQVAILLAQAADSRNFFKGHSWLTLTMLRGNYDLMEALLKRKLVDPNQSLGEDLGTALHVLVSTALQQNTVYEDSLKMCDLLLNEGADPTTVYNHPERLIGTCVDYGAREIEEELERRSKDKTKTKGGTTDKKQKNMRDHVKDHVRVVEYLRGKAEEFLVSYTGKRKEHKKPQHISASEKNEREHLGFASGKGLDVKHKNDSKIKGKENMKNNGNEVTSLVNVQAAHWDGKMINANLKAEGSQNINGLAERKEKGKKDIEDEKNVQQMEKFMTTGKSETRLEKNGRKAETTADGAARSNNQKNESDKKGNRPFVKSETKLGKNAGKTETAGDGAAGSNSEKNKSDNGRNRPFVKTAHGDDSVGATTAKTKKKGEEEHMRGSNLKSVRLKKSKELSDSENKKKGRKKCDEMKNKKKTKHADDPIKRKGVPSDVSITFPEGLRQALLKLFGTIFELLDINDLLLPYVIFRDGNLYYRLKGDCSKHPETYSLV